MYIIHIHRCPLLPVSIFILLKTYTVSHFNKTEYKIDNEPEKQCSIVKLFAHITTVTKFCYSLHMY